MDRLRVHSNIILFSIIMNCVTYSVLYEHLTCSIFTWLNSPGKTWKMDINGPRKSWKMHIRRSWKVTKNHFLVFFYRMYCFTLPVNIVFFLADWPTMLSTVFHTALKWMLLTFLGSRLCSTCWRPTLCITQRLAIVKAWVRLPLCCSCTSMKRWGFFCLLLSDIIYCHQLYEAAEDHFFVITQSDIAVVLQYRKISSIMRTILSLKCWSEVGVRIIHV